MDEIRPGLEAAGYVYEGSVTEFQSRRAAAREARRRRGVPEPKDSSIVLVLGSDAFTADPAWAEVAENPAVQHLMKRSSGSAPEQPTGNLDTTDGPFGAPGHPGPDGTWVEVARKQREAAAARDAQQQNRQGSDGTSGPWRETDHLSFQANNPLAQQPSRAAQSVDRLSAPVREDRLIYGAEDNLVHTWSSWHVLFEHRVNGRIEARALNGVIGEGSGAAVGPRFVATAAHVIYDNDSARFIWQNNMSEPSSKRWTSYYYPGQNWYGVPGPARTDAHPYGGIRLVGGWHHGAWVPGSYFSDFDTAVVILEDVSTIAYETGWLGMGSSGASWLQGKTMVGYGYPGFSQCCQHGDPNHGGPCKTGGSGAAADGFKCGGRQYYDQNNCKVTKVYDSCVIS